MRDQVEKDLFPEIVETCEHVSNVPEVLGINDATLVEMMPAELDENPTILIDQPDDQRIDDHVDENFWNTFEDTDIPTSEFDDFHELTIEESLGVAFVEAKLGMNQINVILRALQPFHPDLPKNYSKILKTPQSKELKVVKMAGGEYLGFDLKSDLQSILIENPNLDNIVLNVNIDGVPAAGNSEWSFCVITTLVTNVNISFISGVFHGKHKPVDQNEFVRPYVDQLEQLCNDGLSIGTSRSVPVKLLAATLDAIGRAPLMRIKHPTGFHSCHQCKVHGRKKEFPARKVQGRKTTKRITFETSRCAERTDEEFRAKVHHIPDKKYVNSHHMDIIPCEFERLNVNMVRTFAIDYMHCCLLGVTRESVNIWCDTVPQFSAKMNDILSRVRSSIPCEFQRTLRDVSSSWKANECRLFLIYLCFVVLPQILPRDKLINFYKYAVGIRILSSKNLISSMCDLAEELIHDYIVEHESLYPSEPINYNLHVSDHLAQNCRNINGTLDDFSCFFGENELQVLKKWYKTGRHPLQQIGRRAIERRTFGKRTRKHKEETPQLSRVKNEDTYRYVQCKDFKITVKSPDNVIFTTNSIYVVNKIYVSEENKIIVCGNKISIEDLEHLFLDPVPSKSVGIYVQPDEIVLSYDEISIDRVLGKCIALREENKDIIIKLLHWYVYLCLCI